MHRRLTFAALFFCLLSCVLLAKPGKTKVSKKKQSKATPAAPKTFNQQLRADYLKQLSLRFKPTKTVKTWTQSSAHKALDAAGGCDGIINGGYGFHTSENASPWWQVDLGSVKAIDVVRVYNRCDNKSAPARMAKLQIKVSTNGKSWTTAFKNDGTVFGGKPDGKPLNAKLNDAKGRYVRLQLPHKGYMHLDEVEVYCVDKPYNAARGRKATQCSTSKWSSTGNPANAADGLYQNGIAKTLTSGRALAADLAKRGLDTQAALAELAAVETATQTAKADPALEALYLRARKAVRKLALQNPLLNFDTMLATKRVYGSFNHMSDQYLGWWSRPGGSVGTITGIKSGNPKYTPLTTHKQFQTPGSFLRPMLSFDGKKVLFAWCKYDPNLAAEKNKLDKANVPEPSFYHLFELDLATNKLTQLTSGKYNDFDARYLPNGEIIFLSTRRSQSVLCDRASAMKTVATPDLGEIYVRCGGGPNRPCAIYTLHTLGTDRKTITAISPMEMFEWTPSVAADGKVLYSRWDYVDRDNMPFMSLWSTNPDGTNPMHVYGNYTRNPHCIFEGRSIPGSSKIIATACGHHAITGGSLILIDTTKGRDGAEPIERITPDVCFPETEGWPSNWYSNPWPLSEDYYLVTWSNTALKRQGARAGKNASTNGSGVYLYDRFGNLDLLYRDASISTMNPAPLRPRHCPTVLSSSVDWAAKPEGTFILSDIYKGMKGVKSGTIKSLRIVAVPAKTHPTMNQPVLGLTRDDPGKCILGTVPVEQDGSAMFRAPSGVLLFFQALDKDGVCIQTMRSGTYLQPGTSQSCVGCHENRYEAPAAKVSLATRRSPSKITVGPEGSWPMRFDTLVQPVLNTHCVGCHNPTGKAKHIDLSTPQSAYAKLTRYGKPSLYDQVWTQYRKPISIPHEGMAANSALWTRINSGHGKVELSADDKARLLTWMDTYAQYLGSYDLAQENRLRTLRTRWDDMLIQPAAPANLPTK